MIAPLLIGKQEQQRDNFSLNMTSKIASVRVLGVGKTELIVIMLGFVMGRFKIFLFNFSTFLGVSVRMRIKNSSISTIKSSKHVPMNTPTHFPL